MKQNANKRLFEDFIPSNRCPLRRSVPFSWPEWQLQRLRCWSCRTILKSTWAGQEVAWCVGYKTSALRRMLHWSWLLIAVTRDRTSARITRDSRGGGAFPKRQISSMLRKQVIKLKHQNKIKYITLWICKILFFFSDLNILSISVFK